jgi:hypothetical protein
MKSNVLLMGEIGSGKTRSLLTLLPEFSDPHTGQVLKGAGLETFVIAMEPGYEAVFGSNGCEQGLHVHYIAPAVVSWGTIRKYVGLLSQKSLDEVLKMTDPGKAQYTQFMEVFNCCADFKCDTCGRSFGDISEWDATRAICLDGLTSLSSVAMHAVVGGKPIRTFPEYGACMEFIEAFFKLYWGNTKCTAVCLAHIDREKNPTSGLSTVTVHTWGQKLAPRLVKIPDEVIIAQHEDGHYTWSTLDSDMVLKRRRLPESPDLKPTFVQLFT